MRTTADGVEAARAPADPRSRLTIRVDENDNGDRRLGAVVETTMAVDWIRDMMTALSNCVLAEDGVVVDYVGDETSFSASLSRSALASTPASRGNVGSDRRFKYGPLGTTVNVASRVQGPTKYLRSRLVVTGATQARLGPEFQCCRARVVERLTGGAASFDARWTPPGK